MVRNIVSALAAVMIASRAKAYLLQTELEDWIKDQSLYAENLRSCTIKGTADKEDYTATMRDPTADELTANAAVDCEAYDCCFVLMDIPASG